MERDFWSKVLHTVSARGAQMVIGLVLTMVTARWLGAEGRGVVVATLGWVNLFAVFGGLSLGQILFHSAISPDKDSQNSEGAEAVEGVKWLSTIIRPTLLITILSTLCGSVIVLLMWQYTSGSLFSDIKPEFLLAAFWILPFLLWEQYGSSILMTLDRIEEYNYRQVLGRFVGLLIVLFLWLIDAKLIYIFGAYFIAQFIVASAGIATIKIAWKESSSLSFAQYYMQCKKLIKQCSALHLNTIGSFAILYADILIINYYVGARETGLYELAMQLFIMMGVVPQAVSNVLLGKFRSHSFAETWRVQRKVLVVTLGIAILLAIIAAFFADSIVFIIGGEDFIESANVFRLLLLAVFGMCFATVMGPMWIARGLFVQVSIISIAIGLINVVAGIMLVPEYGICLLYTSPSPRDQRGSRMPSSA